MSERVRRDFDRRTAALSRVAVSVAMDPEAARALDRGPDAARELFELLDRRLAEVDAAPDAIAVTIYDRTGVALAWVGRPSGVGVSARLSGPSAFFETPSPLGLRLVHVLPILGTDQRRLGSVVAEHALSPAPASATITSTGRRPPRLSFIVLLCACAERTPHPGPIHPAWKKKMPDR